MRKPRRVTTAKHRAPSGQPVGTEHHAAKCSVAQVREIRHLRETHGLSIDSIIYTLNLNLGWSTVNDIANYTTWKHIR